MEVYGGGRRRGHRLFKGNTGNIYRVLEGYGWGWGDLFR